jgi:heme-degrading monooxygenase HmoA
MFIALTRYRTNPDQPWDPARAQALREASTRNQGGSLGAEIYRSLEDPTQMMRITKWNDLADRERWHASEEYRRLVPESGPAREFYELVAGDPARPDGPVQIAVTRFERDSAGGEDPAARMQAIRETTGQTAGSYGALLFRSVENPSQMMRITRWRDLAVREQLHGSDVGRALNLGHGPPREFYELVQET